MFLRGFFKGDANTLKGYLTFKVLMSHRNLTHILK